MLVTVAAESFGGLGNLVNHADDVFSPLGKGVFGGGLDKILTLAILCSASASTQTTILPTARTTLSMGRAGAIPKQFGEIHPRYLSPGFSTIWMGTVSTILYVVLMLTSTNLISDAFTALAVTIAFYYGFSGYACIIYYRKQIFQSGRKFLTIGLIPLLAALFLTWIIVKAFLVYSKADGGYAKPILGIGSPIAIALLTIVLGIIGMLIQRYMMPGVLPSEVQPRARRHPRRRSDRRGEPSPWVRVWSSATTAPIARRWRSQWRSRSPSLAVRSW